MQVRTFTAAAGSETSFIETRFREQVRPQGRNAGVCEGGDASYMIPSNMMPSDSGIETVKANHLPFYFMNYVVSSLQIQPLVVGCLRGGNDAGKKFKQLRKDRKLT